MDKTNKRIFRTGRALEAVQSLADLDAERGVGKLWNEEFQATLDMKPTTLEQEKKQAEVSLYHLTLTYITCFKISTFLSSCCLVDVMFSVEVE